MRTLGYFLITVGFLAGSYAAIEQQQGVLTGIYLIALAAGIVGVVLARRATEQAATSGEIIASNLGAIESSLETLVARTREMAAGKDDIDVFELRHKIDREFPDVLNQFVEARESVSRYFGLQAYADMMNPFAAGERYLNRVWSTSTDGYIDEAHTYIDKAQEQFEEALEVFRSLSKEQPRP